MTLVLANEGERFHIGYGKSELFLGGDPTVDGEPLLDSLQVRGDVGPGGQSVGYQEECCQS